MVSNGLLDYQSIDDEGLRIVRGLGDGDLGPLAAFLRAGGLSGLTKSPEESVSIPAWVAVELASMIEGQPWCFFRLEATTNKRGKTWTKEMKRERERELIGFFVEKRLRELGPGQYETAVAEARSRFKRRRTYVTGAHGEVRKYVQGKFAQLRWRLLETRYSAELG